MRVKTDYLIYCLYAADDKIRAGVVYTQLIFNRRRDNFRRINREKKTRVDILDGIDSDKKSLVISYF